MQDHGYRRTRTRAWSETAFETAFGAGKNNFWHLTCRRKWGSDSRGPERTRGGEWAYIGPASAKAIAEGFWSPNASIWITPPPRR